MNDQSQRLRVKDKIVIAAIFVFVLTMIFFPESVAYYAKSPPAKIGTSPGH